MDQGSLFFYIFNQNFRIKLWFLNSFHIMRTWLGKVTGLLPCRQEAFVDVTAEELVLRLSHHFSLWCPSTCHSARWDATKQPSKVQKYLNVKVNVDLRNFILDIYQLIRIFLTMISLRVGVQKILIIWDLFLNWSGWDISYPCPARVWLRRDASSSLI